MPNRSNYDLRDALTLYLVTDSKLCEKDGVIETVQAAVRGGVTMVQLRDKTAPTDMMIERASLLKAVLAGSNVLLVINDNVEAALAADVDGVHIGQKDANPLAARHMLGPNKIIGLSCETLERVQSVETEYVDYLGLGPVFATPTKGDHDEPIGLAGLEILAAHSTLPTVAIGGLKISHCDDIFKTTTNGMAVVSAICGQHDPETEARKFMTSIKKAKA